MLEKKELLGEVLIALELVDLDFFHIDLSSRVDSWVRAVQKMDCIVVFWGSSIQASLLRCL